MDTIGTQINRINGIYPQRQSAVLRSPALIFLIIATSVFVSESFVMFLLQHMPKISPSFEAVLDSTLLLVLISPTLYYFLFRPLVIHIHERNKATEALQKSSEEQFKTMVRTSLDGFWMTDRTGRFLEVNDAYCQLIGYSREELLGMTVHDVKTLDRPEAVDRHIENIIAVGSDRFETRNRCKDGRIVTIEVSANYSSACGGQLYCFIRDMTERIEGEEALRLAGSVFHNMEEGVLVADANATIIAVNPAFTSITGYTSDEAVGNNPRLLSSGKHPPEFYQEMWRQLKNSGAWSGEIWDKRKNGEIYPKWLTISTVKNEAGEIFQYVAIFNDITARKRAEEEILNLAFYDALTQLPNRRLLLDRFRSALPVSARNRLYGAVLFLDMDKFKNLNDTLGHDYGDQLLIEVARRIQANVREGDTVARFGGDEFVVLLEGVGASAEDASQKAAMIAEKLRLALSAPYMLKGHKHHSSPSIGVSLYLGNEESVDALLKRADLAMYQAKEAGRNTVRFFDPLMQQAVETRASLEADLRYAVLNQQLLLYYQVQVCDEHRPLGAEVLVRWMHPERGMIMPAQFIPVAEESSLIIEIGDWVLDAACRQLAAWADNEQMRRLTLAVNVSAHQFRQSDFVGKVTAITHLHGVDPARLKLELTESVILNDVADVMAKMRALKNIGVKLSMDDFGTGYSSLSYLKQLPLDQLKIDQSFVRDIATNSNDAVMIQTIIDMAQNFGISVIAEGVETEAQLNFLKQNGCMVYQGYLFSKPVPIGEFEQKVMTFSARPKTMNFRLPYLLELAGQAY
ncbi:MAG: EAL domain-containing protein [Gallionella sp.]|jgi:diguanylate cyclase (GGDEF)-like protein/PAS domain S-box-containing protein|nr:EAL domain-containing protein [Gallionella sp.]MCK9354694.1 EAL domain-containing protein [Gallionella sp.]